MEARRLRAILSAVLERDLDDVEQAKFSKYLSLISRWNRVHSLTGMRSEEEIAEGLLADSLRFLDGVSDRAARVIDIGSGAGIPGIPLKIVSPDLDLVLVEARRKRASFLATAVRELELERVRVVGSRAEDLLIAEPNIRGTFDFVVARAAGQPGEIRELGFEFLRPGGMLVLGGGKPSAGGRVPAGFEVLVIRLPKARSGVSERTLLTARKLG